MTTVQLNDIEHDETSLVDEWTKLLNNEYGYNGEAQTVDGLQYLRSRYYDAETGVFISRDSYRGEVQDLLSQNRYTYARNNPIKYDDPTGHLPLNGVNKYASNASMDVGDSLKRLEPLKGSFSSTGTKNTSYNKGPLLTGTSKTPSVKTAAVMFDEGDVTTDKQTQATGALENDDPGTVSSIVTESYDNTQPYGVETYDAPEREAEVMDWKEMAKLLFSGAIFFGSGMLGGAAMSVLGAKLAGAASVLPSVSSYLKSVGFATAAGFAAPFAEVISEISVEWQSLDEYAESQGTTLEIYVNNLIVDAQGAAMMGMLADTLCFIIGDYVQSIINHFKTSRVITNQADDAAKAVENAVSTGQKGMTAGESGSTTTDIYSFGNKSAPRGARPKQDFNVENFDSIVGPETGPLPKGASNVLDVNSAPLSGHYHMLPAGTQMPDGLDIIADGIDVIPNSTHGVGHHTIFPTRAMTINEFNDLYKSLPWQYGGKK